MDITRKALRSSTIIPDDLYVDRAADRQLDAIIDDMGRPGYVLVARQMGKTNLLLRMKRRREQAGDLVLYYDLSQPFETARDLFRHVIDGISERIGDGDLVETISQERARLNLEPNAEYDRHIRLALQLAERERVIIVLDEIDSLVGREYSDRILAQIRSMYFARANYSVYECLTYVLSGVAEPTDLIKDKNISPFNIVEKIYLSDFSLSEVSQLVRKANLNFDREVVEAVYSWAAGNPRMTWDIFSALEDVSRGGELVSATTVNGVVEHLYLTRHDRPPVDHIRVLAETDREVRTALISLLYGKGDTLDDGARSKLYLAGITGASANESPRIKNRIIESALSEAWLTQMEAKLTGIGNTASNLYRDGNFAQVIQLYKQLIEVSGKDSLSDIQLLELGLSEYKQALVSDALLTFTDGLEKTKSRDLKNTFRFYLANSYVILGKAKEATHLLEEVIKFNDSYRLQAKHALSSAYLALSLDEFASKIIALCNEVIAEVDQYEELSEAETAELKAASLYNLSQAYVAIGESDRVQSAIRAAIISIDDERYPGLAALVVRSVDVLEERQAILRRAAELVFEHRPCFSILPTAFEFNAECLIRLLDAAIELKEGKIIDGLLEFGLSQGEGSHFERALSLVRSQSDATRGRLGRNAVLRFAFSNAEVVSSSTPRARLEAARLWLEISSEPDNSAAFKIFVKELNQNPDLIQATDLLPLVNRFSTILRFARHDDAIELMAFVRSHENNFRDTVRAIFVLYVQHEMSFYRQIEDDQQQHEAAREIIRLTTPSNIRQLEIPNQFEALVNRLRQTALDTIGAKLGQGIINYGRNDLVLVRDKRLNIRLVTKYKKVSEKIRSGEFELIGRADAR